MCGPGLLNSEHLFLYTESHDENNTHIKVIIRIKRADANKMFIKIPGTYQAFSRFLLN